MFQESGRSMIEMLGVLAIMGVITVGAIGMISTAMRTQKLTMVNDQVVQMVTMVRNLHAEYDDFSSMNGATVFGAISMSNQNPYGGTYELSPDQSNPRQFIVKINGLGQSECDALMAKAWTDSIGYQLSDGKQGGATGSCKGANGTNYVQITYGE
ncbi:MAG: hypothetical protein IJE79_04750 [Alphaproteobacteria bacterium]|nr:hypothetical protein [Alphaproteobacteria bacterium]